MQSPIHSIKHFRHINLTNVTSGARNTENVLVSEGVPTTAGVGAIKEGSIVRAIYFELWLTSDDAAQCSGTVIIYKLPAGATAATHAQIVGLGTYDNKRNVLQTVQGLFGPNTQPAMNVFKGWLKIPKGKQRMALGDKINIGIASLTNGMSYCGFVTYKEYQ